MIFMVSKLKEAFFIFFVYAVIGWIYELFIFYYHDGVWVNRGFLYGPYLPVYGFGMLLLSSILGNIIKRKSNKFKDWVVRILIVLISVFVIATLVEYITHYVMDVYFDIKLWDYSNEFLNINGRVCFNASRNFAIGGTLLLFVVHPLILKIINNCKKLNLVCWVLLFVIVSDFIITIFTKYV